MATFRYYKLTANNDADYISLIRDKLVLEGWELLVDNGTSIIVRPAGTENYYEIKYIQYSYIDTTRGYILAIHGEYDGTTFTPLSYNYTSYSDSSCIMRINFINFFVNSTFFVISIDSTFEYYYYSTHLYVKNFILTYFGGQVATADSVYSGIFIFPETTSPYSIYFSATHTGNHATFKINNRLLVGKVNILSLPGIYTYITSSIYYVNTNFLLKNRTNPTKLQFSRQPIIQGKKVFSNVLVYGEEDVNGVIYYYPVGSLPIYLTHFESNEDYLRVIEYNNRKFVVVPILLPLPSALNTNNPNPYPNYGWAIEVDNI